MWTKKYDPAVCDATRVDTLTVSAQHCLKNSPETMCFKTRIPSISIALACC